MTSQLLTWVSLVILAAVGCQPSVSSSSASKGEQAGAKEESSAMSQRRDYVKLSDEQLRSRLSALEYAVTQRAATEPPFQNRYWDQHGAGLYVDVVSGEPLFSSTAKFDSGTGWPSFSDTVNPAGVRRVTDVTHGMQRVEVRSTKADSHLGHLFDDGPKPTGLRYCMNSAALRFVPKDKLVAEGYGEYLALFEAVDAGDPVFAPKVAQDNACATPRAGSQGGCQSTLEVAYLAGGCFWGMQDILRKIPGVVETKVGYMGGRTEQPSYDTVHLGKTGHAETVRVTFDPVTLPFAELLENWFFRMHDPTTVNRQGNDQGTQYRSAIFYGSESQREQARAAIRRVEQSGRWKAPVVTELVSAGVFTDAEDHHQDYLVKHPGGYTCHFLRP